METKYLLLIILLFLLPNSCSDVINDRCAGKKPVTAEFTISQYLYNYITREELYIPTDTVMIFNNIKFEALGDYDYYEWQLGDDPTIYTGKSQKWRFKEPWGRLTMRLVVRGKPDSDCFPTDDGIDTLYKSFLVIATEDAAILGSYIGYHTTDTLDTFTVDIKYEGGVWGITIFNINKGFISKGDIKFRYSQYDWTNNMIIFKGDYEVSCGLEAPVGTAILQDDFKTLVVEYESGLINNRKKYKFIGVKK